LSIIYQQFYPVSNIEWFKKGGTKLEVETQTVIKTKPIQPGLFGYKVCVTTFYEPFISLPKTVNF
jgi:hypothetical protein